MYSQPTNVQGKALKDRIAHFWPGIFTHSQLLSETERKMTSSLDRRSTSRDMKAAVFVVPLQKRKQCYELMGEGVLKSAIFKP